MAARFRWAPVGELYLGGAGLARGYAGRPELTAERFVRLPNGTRAYRTGDLVTRQSDGSFDFQGRADDQVQIRGHRVEPGEIAAVLARHPGVTSAVVVPHPGPGGEPSLAAYYVPRGPDDPGPADLLAHLKAALPSWMIPTAFVALAAFPQTANGKLDRAALPSPHDKVSDRVAPRTGNETALFEIWSEVLGHQELGVTDLFEMVGGHSLAAAQVDARIASRMGVAPGRWTTVSGLTIAAQADALAESAVPSLPLRTHDRAAGPSPATAAQRRLWLLDQVAAHRSLYNNGLLFRLSGPVDETALQAALHRLAERHEILRTGFLDGPDGPRQVVQAEVELSLRVTDLREYGSSGVRVAEEQQRRLVAEPFDLSRPPLLRALLLRYDEQSAELLLGVHHIAFDGASIEVFIDDLAELYAAQVEHREARLPDLPVQPTDVGWWEAEVLDGPAGPSLRDYWSEQFATPVAPLALPTERPRPTRPAFRGSTVSRALPTSLADQLTGTERGSTAGPLLAGLAALLHRHTRQTDLVIGVPVAGRTRTELEPLVGCFVNTVPLRCRIDPAAGFDELLRSSYAVLSGALAHQELPFEQILAEAERHGSSAADLVRVMLAVQPRPAAARALPHGRMEFGSELHSDTARFDLTFVLEYRDQVPTLTVEYDRDLFARSSVAAMLDQLLVLLAAGLDAPATAVAALPLMSPEQARQAAELGDGGPVDLGTRPVTDLVAATAARQPAAEAVVCGGHRLSYAEVIGRADVLSAALAAHRVTVESPVVVGLERSAASVIALIGVMGSGGVYVPLDPAYPDDRLRQVLQDLGPSTLVTSAALHDRLHRLYGDQAPVTVLLDPTGQVIDPPASDQNVRPPVTLGHAAYVVYTSGSTGRPKGVVLEHRGLLNLVRAKINRFQIEPDARVLQYVSFGFGVSVADVLTTLVAGGTLVVRGPEPLAGSDLARTLRDQRITHLVVPPSVLATMPETSLPRLRTVVVGGEPCAADLVQRWAPGRRFVQAYGPTEATVCSSTALCTPDDGRPPVGRPLPGVRMLIVDQNLAPVPPGMTGEVLIGGVGLARGYLDRPDLTAERFVPDPTGQHPGERCYRTGDLGRIRPDGQFELLGRDDAQLQLRGIRVEAGDVEAALRAHPSVAEAAVAIRRHATSGDLLVGYVVLVPDAALEPAAVRAFLRDRLPSGLVPAVVIEIETLPRTGSGKLDRRALPGLPETVVREGRRPGTLTEELLARIWSELLQPEDPNASLDIDDDFFALGGQSLIAAQVVSRIRDEFSIPCSIRDLYDAPTVAALALQIDARSGQPLAEETAPDVADPEQSVAPHPERLSAAQRRIWFLDRLHPGTAAYHIPIAWRLLGPIDSEALAGALGAVVERHQVLRTRIAEVDGQPRGELGSAADFHLDRELVPGEPALAARLAELSRRPFDLAADLPIRAALLQVAGTEIAVLALVVHHIAFDGWSAGVLGQEVSAAYAARRVGDDRPWPPLIPQYADTVPDPAADPDPDRAGYWRERLAGAPQVLALPLDRARPAQPSGGGAIHEFAIPAPLADGIRALATAEHSTTFTVLLAAFAAAAAGWTGADDVLVGVPVANRDQRPTQDLIGCFINTVPIRVTVDPARTGRQLVQRLRTDLLDDLEHALDFEQLVDAVGADRSRAVSPLVQALFVAADNRGGALRLPGVEVSPLPVDPGAAKLDLSVSVDTGTLVGETMPVQLTYSTDVFTAATADRLAEQFVSRLAGLLADPDQPAAGLALGEPDPAETEDGPTSVAEGSVLELYRAQVRRVPDRRAVVDDQVALSYAELDRRSRAVAAELRRRGAGPETTVGLLAERSVDAVVGLLGVLLAGAAYVPVDPAQPAARIAAILESAGAELVITQRTLAALVPDRAEAVLLEELALADPDPGDPAEVSPRSLAYVVATSGSTGTPKPVAVEHRQLRAYVDSIIDRCDLAEMGSFAVVSTLAADLGHTSLFPALCTGATLRMVGATAATDPTIVAELLRRDPVDVLKIVPAQLNAWLSGPDPAAVLPRRRLILGGDAAGWTLVDRVRELAPQLRLFNHYGPTEATVGALTHELTDLVDDRPPSVPLGSPLPHAVARVLDDHLRPVPTGVGGELFLGGASVARGYLGQPELTAQRFLADPYASDPTARLYRTGDRVRRRSDGTIEFLGRTDEQVKIRGYRVEPGEVAAALRRHPSVRDAAVLVDRDEAGESRLTGFVAPHDPGNGSHAAVAQGLRDHLVGLLPAALVPARLLVLDALPLTGNGKIDRAALLALPALDGATPPPSRLPSTERERQVAEIWSDVLHLDQIGADDNFFALGGHSLLATQVVARFRQRLGLEVAVSTLFEFPTIAALAGALDGAAPATVPPLGPAPVSEPIPLSDGQRRLWFLDQAAPGESTYNLPYALRLRGRLDADLLERSLERVVARHEALRSTFGSADGEPRVLVHPAGPVPLERLDLAVAADPEAAVRELVDAEFRRPFDLARGSALPLDPAAGRPGRPRAAAELSPHRVRRLVLRGAARRTGRVLRRLRFGSDPRPAAASAGLRRLRPLAGRIGPGAGPPTGLLDAATGRSAGCSRTADRPAPPAADDPPRRRGVAGAAGGIDRAGEAVGRRPQSDPLHGAAGRVPGPVGPAHPSAGSGRRHPGGRAAGRPDRADGRVLRQHAGAAHRPLGRALLLRADRPGPHHHAGRVRAPGPALRPAGRGIAAGAGPQPVADLPDDLHPAQPAGAANPVARADLDHRARRGRGGQVRPVPGAHRTRRRAGRRPGVQQRPLRPGHGRPAGGPVPAAARGRGGRTRSALHPAGHHRSRGAGRAGSLERHRRRPTRARADHRAVRPHGRRPAGRGGADRRGRHPDLRRAGPTGQPACPPAHRPRRGIRAARRPAGRPVGGDGGRVCSASSRPGRRTCRSTRATRGTGWTTCSPTPGPPRWSPPRAWRAPRRTTARSSGWTPIGRRWPGSPRRRPGCPSIRISSRTCSTPPAPPADPRASRSPTGRWSMRCSALVSPR